MLDKFWTVIEWVLVKIISFFDWWFTRPIRWSNKEPIPYDVTFIDIPSWTIKWVSAPRPEEETEEAKKKYMRFYWAVMITVYTLFIFLFTHRLVFWMLGIHWH